MLSKVILCNALCSLHMYFDFVLSYSIMVAFLTTLYLLYLFPLLSVDVVSDITD